MGLWTSNCLVGRGACVKIHLWKAFPFYSKVLPVALVEGTEMGLWTPRCLVGACVKNLTKNAFLSLFFKKMLVALTEGTEMGLWTPKCPDGPGTCVKPYLKGFSYLFFKISLVALVEGTEMVQCIPRCLVGPGTCVTNFIWKVFPSFWACELLHFWLEHA